MSTLTQNNPDLIQERNHSLLNDSDLAVRVADATTALQPKIPLH